MGSTAEFVGNHGRTQDLSSPAKAQILASIERLAAWLEENEYRGYDTFDGLNARYVRPLTFENQFLRTLLQQGIRRFPMNVRPLLGVCKSRSSKGMGFLARGFTRMHQSTGDPSWAKKADFTLRWLIDNKSPGYSGACWGNHFDYQSRTFYLPKGVPTVVWTSLIGHAFLEGYEQFGNEEYLQVAVSACQHILHDLECSVEGNGICISYIPTQNSQVHNANTLGASLLARAGTIMQDKSMLRLARNAMDYTAQHQRSDCSWFYGEKENLHWVDNFHTAYVLDCFKHYSDATNDTRYDRVMMNGYGYWKNTFFLADGTPRYYDHKTLPIDIQCSSQAIDTLVFFSARDPEAVPLALKIADWTIRHMQDGDGHFYYRRYSSLIVNKTATLHWGQATMLCALAGLYRLL
jgi:hypothetical protein